MISLIVFLHTHFERSPENLRQSASFCSKPPLPPNHHPTVSIMCALTCRGRVTYSACVCARWQNKFQLVDYYHDTLIMWPPKNPPPKELQNFATYFTSEAMLCLLIFIVEHQFVWAFIRAVRSRTICGSCKSAP